MRAARMLVATLVLGGSWACASSGSGSTNAGGDAAMAVSSARSSARRNPDLITESEISSRASEAANAMQIVQKLRPQMLQTRGMASPTDVTGEAMRPRVYVDNISYGDLTTLQNLTATQVKEIKFLNARDATTIWGTGHMGGVILVTTKR